MNGRIASAASLSDSDTTLTTDTIGSGAVTVSPTASTFAYGQSVMLNALPDPGWQFDQWSGTLERVAPWWNTYWPYRIALYVDANGFARQEKLAEETIDFTQLFSQLGETGSFEKASIRVVEIDKTGAILDADVPFQFDQDAAFNASNNAKGNLIILMSGSIAATEGRLYHVYFAPTGNPYFTPSFSSLVTANYNATDQGQNCYQFDTTNATYFFDRDGGGFSSLNDLDGDDWISYNNTSGSGGKFRGIPNLIYRGTSQSGGFHPALSGSTSTPLYTGPLKASYRTVDGGWEALWEIYPDSVRMTLLQAEHNYWFLYEGTPGGALDSSDFSVRSDATTYAFNASWTQDMPGNEWIYFADPNAGTSGRSLFLVHHESDSQTDSYRRMSDSNGAMTVFGFGRDGISTKMSAVPQHFTFGLIDETSYAAAKPLIEAAYKDLTISLMSPESINGIGSYVPGSATTFTVTMTMNRAITATFVPEYYAVNDVVIGNGIVNFSTPANPAGFFYGEPVTVTATANPGWSFVGWDGLISGGANPQVGTVTASSVVTATFEPIAYAIDLVPPTNGGTTAILPSSPTYVYGDVVELTATPAPGYRFVRWVGDLTSTNAVETVTVTQDMTIGAEFELHSYVLVLTTDGNGAVLSTPNQATYLYDDEVTLTAVPDPGWRFSHWEGALTGANSVDSLIVRQDEAVTAVFVQEAYTLSSNVVGSGTVAVDPNTPTYLYGAQVTLTANPTAHWQFMGWSGDLTGIMASETVTITNSRSITATFTPVLYTVTTTTLGNGTAQVTPSANPTGYVFGEVITLTATPATDWIFVEWIIDGANGQQLDSSPSISINVDGMMALTARFQQAIASFVPQVVGAGEVRLTPDLPEYLLGQPITLTATADLGWRFVAWSDPALGNELVANFSFDPRQTITATFVQELYPVTLHIVGDGAVVQSPQSSTYTYGQVVDLMATPAAGWYFSGWQGGLISTTPTLPLTVAGRTIITATFSQTPYNLLTTKSGSGRIEVVNNGQVLVDVSHAGFSGGETLIIRAIAESGWYFAGWGGDLSGKNTIESLAMDSNKSISATFLQVAPDPTDPDNPGGSNVTNLYLPLISTSE